ncbi:hemagglutinin repeat-containing protein [Snodgrassella alvi]|uniref:hemagglutinin repeat-containing protein n=2 Tax=Snodgrassella TaxID=1193515 RepID=UPI003514DEDB
MNKNRYKVIFNKKRGILVAVAENTIREGKSTADRNQSGGTIFSSLLARLPVLTSSILLGLGLCVLINHSAIAADIHADPSAPKNQQPTILQTANGIPQINIQTPSKGGVSINQYRQLDVNKQGAILNNSRKSTQTKQAGWIQGNPWLAKGEAGIIVNQINSSNPSRLNGYIEVAGRRAEVIMANPSGISVNGGGFINAAGVTLTTGRPVLNNGSLDGFQVRGGNISINGQGLDTSGSDYTNILTKAAQINAGIWANKLNISTGSNDINAQGQITANVNNNISDKQSIAIDSSSLGGMYAGKIVLISNDKGVGINNAGQIFAGAGGVSISTDGRLSNSGSIVAADKNSSAAEEATAAIHADSIRNSGTLSSQGKMQLQSQQLDNSGLITSADELNIRNRQQLSNQGEINGGRLDISSGSIYNQQGKIIQSGQQSLKLDLNKLNNSSNSLIGYAPSEPPTSNSSESATTEQPARPQKPAENQDTPVPTIATGAGQTEAAAGTPKQFASGQIISEQEILNDNGQIIANGGIDLNAHNGLTNRGTLNLNKLQVSGELLDNQQGKLNTGEARISTGRLDNRSGEISSRGPFQYTGKELDNRKGRIQSTEQIAIEAENTDNSDSGVIAAQKQLQLHSSGQIDNSKGGQLWSGGTAEIQTANLNNNSGAIDSDSLQLKADSINNQLGAIRSVNAQQLTVTNQLNNHTGQIGSNGQLTIQAGNIDNTAGKISAAQQAEIHSSGFNNQQGTVDAENIKINADTLNNNHGAIRANGETRTSINQSLNNQQGQISSQKDVYISGNALQIDNSQNGQIIAGQNLTLQAQNLNNPGTIAAGHDAEIALTDNFSVDADITAGHNLTISSQGTISNSHTLSGGDSVRLQAADIDNQASGTIQSNNQTELQAQSKITNRGLINSNGTTLVQSGNSINNIGTGRIYGNHVAIGSHDLYNQEETSGTETKAAVIAARQRLDIGATDIVNKEHALLSSEGDIAIGGSLNQQHQAVGMADNLLNSSARIEAQGNGNIAVRQLQNLNNHFAVEEYLDNSKKIFQIQEKGNPAIWVDGVDGKFKKGKKELSFKFNDGTNKKWKKYSAKDVKWWDYKSDTYKQRVTESQPAEIIIGGDLTISGEHWVNNNSRIIIGGNLTGGDSLNLENQETKGQQRVENHGQQGGYKYKNPKLGSGKIKKTGEKPYNETIITSHEFDTPVSVVQQHAGISANQGKAEQAKTGNQLQPQDKAQTQTENHNQSIQSLSRFNTNLPNSSLYHINPTNSGYLVETDPAFTNMKKWLGSDYMLSALGQNPDRMQKRLGDGYYEQKLINEQIAQLTGYRRLEGYSNDEEQYKALMNAGISFAQQFHITPGVALSAEQMAQLTSDMVWLVNQTVTLADGSQQTVLVPKIYLKVRDNDVTTAGALISAHNINLQNSGNINNQGSIAGQNILSLGAQNIDNSGMLSGSKVALTANDSINFNGGSAVGKDLLSLKADKINLNTTTASYGDERNGGTVIDRTAGLYVTGDKDAVLSVAGTHGITTRGASIVNNADNGTTQLSSSAGSIDLNTVTTRRDMTDGSSSDKNHWINHYQNENGTSISAAGDIQIQAADQFNIRQGDINSENGNVSLHGKNGVNIIEGRQQTELDHSVYIKSSGLMSKKTSLDQSRANYDEAVGSNITGAKVSISSDQDINIRGSNIISDNGTVLKAGQDVNITAASNQYQDQEYHKETKSGLMGSGGIGFSIGKQKETDDTTSRRTIHSGSSVGSLNGDTTIVAGNHYTQTGSSVSSPQGNVNIIAKQIDINAAEDQYSRDNIHTFEKSGLTVAVNVPIVNAIQTASTAVNRIGESKNARVNAMAAFNAGVDLYKAGNAAADLANNPQNATNVSVSITVGQQKSRSETHSRDSVAAASQINAGGEVNLLATGAGQDSNINIIGSDVNGKQGTHLQADNEINLLAAEQNHSERSSNKSSGWNAGATIGIGSGGPKLGITAGVNAGKGHGNGDETSYRNSHIGSSSGNTSLTSGGATNIKGAQVAGKGVQIDAAELNIESLQDTAKYNSKQQNISGQVTVGYGASASASFSKSKIKADYAAVTEQSGIIAGDNGYQLNIKGNTDLKGAIITSTAAAEAAGKNQVITGSLTSSDIHNHSDYSGSSIGIGASGSVSGSTLGQKQPTSNDKINLANQGETGASKSLGFGHDSGHSSSTTHSGINTGNIIITDAAAQQQKTGKSVAETIAGIHTDTSSDNYADKAGYLSNNFDKDKVQKELDTQREVTQEFSANIQATSAMINSKKDSLKEKLKDENLTLSEREQYEKELSQWNTGGLLLNAIGAGLAAPTNSVGGILAATASPVVSYQIGQYFKGKEAEGSTAHLVAHAVLGAAVAAAGGNDALAGALAAGGSEAIGPVVSKWLYDKEPKDLTAEEKATVSAISGLAGAATGAVAGGSMADAAQGNQAAHAAVDNNRLIVTGDKAAKKRYLDLLNKAQKQYKYKIDEKNRIVIDGYHYDDTQNPPVLVSDNPKGGTLNPTDVANKTIIDAINKNEDIYLRLISDPKYIVKNHTTVDDYSTGDVNVTKEFFDNSDTEALYLFILHLTKERFETENYEQIKSEIFNDDGTIKNEYKKENIFMPSHNLARNAEYQYLKEKYPDNVIHPDKETKPFVTKWKGMDVIQFTHDFGDKVVKTYYTYEQDSTKKYEYPLKPIATVIEDKNTKRN